MRTSRRLIVGLTTAGLAVAVSLAGAIPANAALPTDPAQIDIVVFGAAGVNDIGQEVVLETNVLVSTGAVVTAFNGGDGSDVAWTAALASADVLVLPELEGSSPFYEAGGTAVVSTAAASVVAAWVAAGGVVIMNSSYSSAFDYGYLLSTITAKDYDSVFTRSTNFGGVWDLQQPFAGAPATINWADGTYGLAEYGTWSADLLSIVQPVYLTTDGQDLAVGNFSVGAGYVTFLAYDWYPDFAPSVADWDNVLSLVATGIIAPPAPVVVPPVVVAAPAAAAAASLPVTGPDADLPVGIAAALVLAGAVLMIIRRRSSVRA